VCGGEANGNDSQEFDAWIRGIKVDCNGIKGCIGVQNKVAQENSGVYDSSIVNWGANGPLTCVTGQCGVGLQILGEVIPTWLTGTSYKLGYRVVPPGGNGHWYQEVTILTCTSGSMPTWKVDGTSGSDGGCTWQDKGSPTTFPSVAPGNSSYSRLIVQNSKSALACDTKALGIFVDDPTSSGVPKSIETVTINSPACAGATTPTDDMRISTGGQVTPVSIRDIHVETATNGITVGADRAAEGITIDGIGANTSFQVNISSAFSTGNIWVRNVECNASGSNQNP